MTAFGSLVRAGAVALAPLERALADPGELAQLLRELGYEVGVSAEAHERIAELIPVAAALEALPGIVDSLDDGGAAAAAALVELVEVLAEIAQAVSALVELDESDLQSLPGLLSTPGAWTDLAGALPDHLLATHVAQASPPVFAALRLTGVSTSDVMGRAPRYRFRWDELGSALGAPEDAVKEVVGWGSGLRTWPLQRELGLLLARLGLPVRVGPMRRAVAEAIAGAPVEEPSGVESDIVLFRGTNSNGELAELGLILACAPDGDGTIYVGNLAYGSAGLAVPLGETWTLEAAGSLDGTATLGVRLQPSGLSLVGGDAAVGASIALDGRPPSPWILVGSADGTRVELDAARIEFGVTGTADEPEAYGLVRIDEGAFRFVLDLGGADSFLRSVIGGAPPAITAGGELRWGTSSGLSFGGGLGLEVTLPIDKDAGPLHVDSLTLALGAGDTGARLAATAVAGLTIGPFTGTVGGIGAALELTAGDGGLDAQLAFVPPTRIGLEVDIAEVVTGGGFVDHDPELGRYTGALALEFPAVGLGAIVVVDTQLAGDPDGWALFASIFATFTSLPLGFGFFLSGVGGLVCINRTLDAEAIAGGLKSGAVDAILFPDKPVDDAELIISQLDAWFPLVEGSAVFGIAATITWGTPKAIVTGQLGVMVSFPDIDIAVLGSVFLALPTEEEALLELHMDTIGMIDTSEQTLLVAASLYDSSLLQTIHLSGDMAMYASFGNSPYFLLSIGGYNPHFEPPAGLPASVTNVSRMRAEVAISEDVWFALEAYVAVTSNTLQFGAQASLEASAKFLTSTYTARGEVGFDVLLVFSPFAFIADFYAGVAVTVGDGDKELLAVDLDAHLEGPKPWYATGSARFTFFMLDVKFELEVGGSAGAEAPPRENVLELVLEALREPSAWRGALAAGADTTVVVLAAGPEVEDEVWVRPDAELEAVQTVAPLSRPLDRYGIYDIDGPTTLDVTAVEVKGDVVETAWEPVLDWFAPAQYDDLTRTEKLGAPSYEEMTAGVRFGAGGVSFPDAEAVTVTPDFEVRVLDEDRTRVLKIQRLAGALQQALASLRLEPSGRRAPRTVTSVSFSVGATRWQSADATTGVASGTVGTYREALAAVDAAVAADPAARGSLRIAPESALVATPPVPPRLPTEPLERVA